MAVISISIQESSEQIVSGIPRSISISTNIPSTIFYTLDGSDPTLFSDIYTNSIKLPTDSLKVILKIYATNGVDNSPIITETYFTNQLQNARLPRAATDAPAQSTISNSYPFGNSSPPPNTQFLNPGDAGLNVNDPALPTTPTGYDGDGYEAGFTNQPYTFENYDIVYSQTDFIGAPIKMGHLPSNVKVLSDPNPAYGNDTTDYADKFFDPRAFVTYHNVEQEDPGKPPLINRQSFTGEVSEKIRTGNNFFVCGLDAPPTTGSFVRSHYNPRNNTMTYYYYDSIANKWIISTVPYQNKNQDSGELYHMKFDRNSGNGHGYVFSWGTFRRRVLF